MSTPTKETVVTAFEKVKDCVRNTAQELRDHPRECAHHAGQKVREFAEEANVEARDVAAATIKQVRTHPVQASLIAAGVGFLLGALLRRK